MGGLRSLRGSSLTYLTSLHWLSRPRVARHLVVMLKVSPSDVRALFVAVDRLGNSHVVTATAVDKRCSGEAPPGAAPPFVGCVGAKAH